MNRLFTIASHFRVNVTNEEEERRKKKKRKDIGENRLQLKNPKSQVKCNDATEAVAAAAGDVFTLRRR